METTLYLLSSFGMWIKSIANPATYGIDAPTMAILLASFSAVAVVGHRYAKTVLSLFKRQVCFTINVTDRSPGFREIIFWIQESEKKSLFSIRNLTLYTTGKKYSTTNNVETNIGMVFGFGMFFIKPKNLPLIQIVRQERDSTKTDMSWDRPSNMSDRPCMLLINIFTRNPKKVEKVFEEIVESSFRLWGPRLYEYSPRRADTDWYDSVVTNYRSIDSVILPTPQKDAIFQDIKYFFEEESKSFYERAGIPHRRGYLFYGPPGTGKTSLVKAIRSEFKKELYILNLRDIQSDSQLLGLLENVVKGGIVLFEDIDCAGDAAHSRNLTLNDSSKTTSKDVESKMAFGVSLHGLLNAIDGVKSPENVIFIFTTNHYDKLDPAFLRAGRCDVKEKIDFLTPELQWRLFTHIFNVDETMPHAFRNLPTVAACEIQDIALKAFLANKTFDEVVLDYTAKHNRTATKVLEKA